MTVNVQEAQDKQEFIVKDKDADEIINKYAKKSEYWCDLLEKENIKLSDLLSKIVEKIPTHGPRQHDKELDLAITYMYIKAHNLTKAINRLYTKDDSKSITARFVLLRSTYELMCSISYLIKFPEKAELFYNKKSKPKNKELHNGFDRQNEATEMYNTIYNFLCSHAHPDICAIRSNQVLRIYLIDEKWVTIEDMYENVRLIFLELFFNYYYLMVQRNLITFFLLEDGRQLRIPVIYSISKNYGESLFSDEVLRELKTWQDQFPTLSRFMDEVQDINKKYKTKAIEVKDKEDLKSRIEGIYELRKHKELVEYYKKIIDERYK